MHSQMYSSKPFFTKKINLFDSIYFKLSRRIFSLFKIRKEGYINPSKKIIEEMKKSGLYY